jgi:hypothetical protein
MKKSAVKSAIAVALCAAGCVSFAQQASDASGVNGTDRINNNSSAYPQDVNKSSPGMDGTSSSGTGYGANYQSRNRSCSGLSDRQTERACHQGYPTQHDNHPSMDRPLEGGGQTDDQAG